MSNSLPHSFHLLFNSIKQPIPPLASVSKVPRNSGVCRIGIGLSTQVSQMNGRAAVSAFTLLKAASTPSRIRSTIMHSIQSIPHSKDTGILILLAGQLLCDNRTPQIHVQSPNQMSQIKDSLPTTSNNGFSISFLQRFSNLILGVNSLTIHGTKFTEARAH